MAVFAGSAMNLRTARLSLRPFTLEDGPFILRLLNEPSFIQNIADKGVRTLEQAEDYLRQGPMASHAQHGHGLCRVGLRGSDLPIGMCGLIRRDYLPGIDLGYAFLPEHTGQGYALEASRATVDWASETLRLTRLLAIVNPDNLRSLSLLAKLGFHPEGRLCLPGETQEVRLEALDLQGETRPGVLPETPPTDARSTLAPG